MPDPKVLAALTAFEKQTIASTPNMTIADLIKKGSGVPSSIGPSTERYQFVGSNFIWDVKNLTPGGPPTPQLASASVAMLSSLKLSDLIKLAQGAPSAERWYIYTEDLYSVVVSD